MRVRMQKTDVQVVEFDDGRTGLYWCDEIAWREACRSAGHTVKKTYKRLDFKAHDRWDLKPASEGYEDPSDETAKTVDVRVDEAIEKRESPWRKSMGKWAHDSILRREKKQQALEEAKKVETRVAEARAAGRKREE